MTGRVALQLPAEPLDIVRFEDGWRPGRRDAHSQGSANHFRPLRLRLTEIRRRWNEFEPLSDHPLSAMFVRPPHDWLISCKRPVRTYGPLLPLGASGAGGAPRRPRL